MIEAHGLGGQSDRPIPLSLTVLGAVAALLISFAVLILAWRSPRYDTERSSSGWPAPIVTTRLVSALDLESAGD